MQLLVLLYSQCRGREGSCTRTCSTSSAYAKILQHRLATSSDRSIDRSLTFPCPPQFVRLPARTRSVRLLPRETCLRVREPRRRPTTPATATATAIPPHCPSSCATYSTGSFLAPRAPWPEWVRSETGCCRPGEEEEEEKRTCKRPLALLETNMPPVGWLVGWLVRWMHSLVATCLHPTVAACLRFKNISSQRSAVTLRCAHSSTVVILRAAFVTFPNITIMPS